MSKSPNAFKGAALCGMALVSFATGFLTNRAMADSSRLFQLLVYHAPPGKVPQLESRFRDASKLFAKHHLEVVGYWVPEGQRAWDDTFIYVVAHPSREEAKKHWDAMHADPAFQKYVQAEQSEKLIDKVDSTYMRPADFSPLR
jgi:NIPSNAP